MNDDEIKQLVDELPPTQYLMLEVIAARQRLGEPFWTFPSRFRHTAVLLQDKDLINFQYGIIQSTIQAWLTDKGERGVFSDKYKPPVQRRTWSLN